MKILHTVEFYDPSVGGAQEVVKQISEGLVKRGHEVTVATSRLGERKQRNVNGVRIAEFSVSGNATHGLKGETKRYQDLLLSGQFDIVMNYAAQQWATDAALPLLEKIKSQKVFVPCGFSALHRPEYAEYFTQMKRWLKLYDACVYLSNDYRDINFARECGADNNVLIPNGAAEAEFSREVAMDIRAKLDIPKNDFLILHVGSHTGIKGHKEAIAIFKKAKIRNATFLIVADDSGGCAARCQFAGKLYRSNPLSRLWHKKIMVETLSRQETLAAFDQADLFLFPSNIECSPLVLFEAMASKTPFLTTDVGNAKEILEWSRGGDLLPGAKLANGNVRAKITSSANMVERLFHDDQLREKLASNGYDAWKTSFTWEKIVQQYEALYLSIFTTGKKGGHEQDIASSNTCKKQKL